MCRRSSFSSGIMSNVCLFHICHGPNFTNLRIKSLLNPLIVRCCWNNGEGRVLQCNYSVAYRMVQSNYLSVYRIHQSSLIYHKED